MNDAYMSKDVIAAVAQLLPVFFLAYFIEQTAVMRNWIPRNQMIAFHRVLAVISTICFFGIALGAVAIEIVFLFALNGDGAHGSMANGLWISAIGWLSIFTVGVVVTGTRRTE